MNELQVALFIGLFLSLVSTVSAQGPGVGWDVFAGLLGAALGIYFILVGLGWFARRSEGADA